MARELGAEQLRRLRELALALPGVAERVSHGAVCFFIAERSPLCYFHDNHRGDGRVSLWFPASADLQDALVSAEPARFLRPETSAAVTAPTGRRSTGSCATCSAAGRHGIW